MRAGDVIELLAAKHASDIFAGEVKDGPTWYGSAMRLDGWAMRKSWANPCMTGYEVKVSRSDWLGDKKWPNYVELVNEFYLVAPEGVIRESEVPDGIGLLKVAKTGTRLFTVRKAKWREANAEKAILLMQYVLQSRATIDAPRPPQTQDEWKRWLAEKEEKRAIGYRVAKGLREKYERDVEKVQREVENLKHDRAFVDMVIKATEAIGVRWDAGWKYASSAKGIAESIAAVGRGQSLQPHEQFRIREIIPLLEKLAEPSKPAVSVAP